MLTELEKLMPFAVPIGALIVSASAVFISIQQWKLARHKLRLDLYDRRYKVYEAFEDLLLEAANENEVETTTKLIDTTFNSAFLFDKKVVAYLDEIIDRVADHQAKTSQLKVLEPSHPAYNRISLEITENRKWFDQQLDGRHKVFSPYLGFSHVKD